MAGMATELPKLLLYTRPECHLCDEARAIVQGLLEDRAARSAPVAALTERDITTDLEWERRFFDRIPVIELNGRRLDLAISPMAVRRFLADALDGGLV